MDPSIPNQVPPNNPNVTDERTEAGPATPPSADARKPYARPRLIEHGRLSGLTLGASVPQSDRNAKERFEAVDPRAVLAAVAALPIERWSYKGEPVRHLGPMAQDFAAAFGLGADDRHIFTLDAAGVALGAIQGLHALVQAQGARLRDVEQELAALREETATLRADLALAKAELVA